jgi:peptidyl-prolyl cis-trans isomerase D
MTLATIDYAPSAPGDSTIEGYPAFRAAAEAVQAEDFAEGIVLEDGGLVALRLDEVVPAAPIPFDEARDAVADAWRADAMTKALSVRAGEIKAELEAGEPIGRFGIVDVTPEIARDGFVEGVPETLVSDVFKMAEGDVSVVEGDGFVGVVKLDRIQAAEAEGDDAAALKGALSAQLEQAIAADAFSAFTEALTSEAGIVLDQAAINAVHTSLQ